MKSVSATIALPERSGPVVTGSVPKTAAIFLLLVAGCSFDGAALDARRCSSQDECAAFGPGYACTEGYCIAQGEPCVADADCAAISGPCLRDTCLDGHCAPVPLATGAPCPASHACVDATCDGAGACVGVGLDVRCSNGLACDGDERCIPDLAADASGCVSGDPPDVDDGVECTVGRCDDALGGVVQDASACPCQTPGAPCDGVTAPVCFAALCGADYSCELTAEPEGALCDDGVLCTVGGRCTAAQECVSMPDDTQCDDAKFCNGAEVCAPEDAQAADDGCAPGAPLDLSDGIECTIDYCEEATDSVLHDAVGCGCEQDTDCVAPCRIGRCVDSVCDFILAAPGASCDDGATCTTTDICDDLGNCAGQTDDAWCADGAFCNGAERCAPGDADAGADGCVAGVPPVVDDGIACTADRCDETGDRIVHRPGADCPCVDDGDCESECADGACVDFVCEVRPRRNGTDCDDEMDCTVGDACDDGVCLGDADDDRCQNALFCDGAEVCAPQADDRDVNGCIAGPTPAELQDARDCEVLSCDEDADEVVVDDSNCCDPAPEGPRGQPTCADNIDNDCDGLIDSADPNCGFVPTQIGGLMLWLDASDEENLRISGGMDDVNEWFDLSGNDNHASQSGRQRPRFETVDGQNRVRLDGSRWLVVANESQFDFRTGVTAIVVFSVERFDKRWQALLTKGDQTWRVHRNGDSNQIAFGYNNFFGGNDIAGGDPTGGGLHQVMARWDDGESDLWLDAAHVGDRSHLDGSLTRNDDPVWLGNNADEDDRGWKGDVTEVIVYDRPLGGDERALVFDYLRQKWALP